MNRQILGLIGLLMLSTGQVFADVTWSELSANQRVVLEPYESSWADFTAARQQTILKGVDRFLSLNKQDRAKVKKRFKRWQTLSAADQQRIRKRFQAFRQLPPAEQQTIRNRYQQFSEMPLKRRMELRDRWKKLSPERRRKLLKRLHRRN